MASKTPGGAVGVNESRETRNVQSAPGATGVPFRTVSLYTCPLTFVEKGLHAYANNRANEIMTLKTPIPADKMKLLETAYSKVDAYQPVFGFEERFGARPVSRNCKDRCDLLDKYLKKDAPNLRILDVGCSMGYISLHYARAGALVTGLDAHQPNIEFCNVLADTNNIRATFKNDVFSEEFCRDMKEGEFDVAFLFSVLHHVITKYGLERTQRMMADLLDKVDIAFLELARRTETVSFSWKDKLPDNELAILDGIPEVEVTLLGEFPALGMTTSRPLYLVRKKSKYINGILHKDLLVNRSVIRDGRTRDRKYVLTDNLFTKIFNVNINSLESYNRYCLEISARRALGDSQNFLPVLGNSLRGQTASITYPRIDGPILSDILPKGGFDKRKLMLSMISILRDFYNAGLYWNDLRAHNLAIHNGRLVAFDLETSGPVERENTYHLMLWLIWDIATNKSQTNAHRVFERPLLSIPAPDLPVKEFSEGVRDIAELALSAGSLRSFMPIAHRLS